MTDKTKTTDMVSQDDLKKMALDLIDRISTLTLATAGGGGVWSAPVYYVYQNSLFFFFSKPDSRHITEALATGSAAASIHAYADSWQRIQGIQMSGAVKKAGLDLNSIKAVRAYLKKFPFTKEFFKDDDGMNIEDFYNRFKVHLYYFEPGLVYYQDNQIRFGFREAVEL